MTTIIRLHRLEQRHPDDHRVAELAARLDAEPWLTETLEAVAASGLPDAWVGAGVIRDVVWGQLYGGFDPGAVNDIDVAYFDPVDLTRERDQAAEHSLRTLLDRQWEATNQAAVHTWFADYFGGPEVPEFASVHDAVATWPETATCVAIRATAAGLDVCAPCGLSDLLDGVWRRNPVLVTLENSSARLTRQCLKWPKLTVVPPASS